MVDIKELGVIALESKEDATVRAELIQLGLETLDREGLEAVAVDDSILVNFILQWDADTSISVKDARKFLSVYINETQTAFDWIHENYSYYRLYTLYEFYLYCEWLNPK